MFDKVNAVQISVPAMWQELRFYLFASGCNCIPSTSLICTPTYYQFIYTYECLCTFNIENMDIFQRAIISGCVDLTTNYFFFHDIYSGGYNNLNISWLNK